MKHIKKYFNVVKNSCIAFSDDDCLKLSASLSYYTIFALAPFLIIIISLAGIFFGEVAVSGRVYNELNGLIGSEAALQIQEIIANIQRRQGTTTGAIVGAVILFIGATGVFTEIQGSINYIWSVKAKPKKGWRKYLINRLLSFSLILGLGFLLIITLITSTVLNILSDKLIRFFPNTTVYFLSTFNSVFLFVIITALFSVIFKILPDATISWRDALVGATVTAVLFLLGKFIIGFYLGKSSFGITYGTAASVVVILTWVYYSSVILYFGAEFTKVFALESGHGIRPKSTAVFILKREAKEIPQSRLDT
jgi:membrane protein